MVKLSSFGDFIATKPLLISLALALILTFTCPFSTSSLAAQENMRIAVLDFGANNVSKFTSKAVSEILSTEIAKKGDLVVVERSQMGAILQEQGFQMTGCTDSECAVQIGKVLSANKILIGTLSRLGNVYSIVARVVNVETGHIEFAESERCTSEDDVEQASRFLAVRLLNRITGKQYSLPSRTYETGREWSRFAISGGFRYGQVYDVAVPVVQGEKVTKENRKMMKIITIVVSPSYGISDYLTLKSNLKYYMIGTYLSDAYASQIGDYGTANSLVYAYYSDTYETPKIKGWGIAVNIQYNYPIGGFIPFASAGFGFTRFEMDDSLLNKNISYEVQHISGTPYTYDARVHEWYELSGSDYIAWMGEIELGFAFDISKYVSLVFTVGVEIPLAAQIFGDVDIKRSQRSTSGDLGLIPDEDETISDTLDPDDFKGNFPPIYFIQAAVSYRIY